MNEVKTGILLEGGAMRSIFSAGILDYFLENNIEIPNVLAVSAGAYAGMNYVSGQKGRILESNVKTLKKYRYSGFRVFLKKRCFFDMDFLFDHVPRKIAPFDFAKFNSSGKRFVTSTVNCKTGETLYHDSFPTEDNFYQICRAANSLPFLAPIVQIDGTPMLDGGMGDAIPIIKAMEEKWDKIIIILTRKRHYRKKHNQLYFFFLRICYRKYPEFIKIVLERKNKYNRALEQIFRLEEEGKAFVFCPETVELKNSEFREEILMEYYQEGYNIAQKEHARLEQFLSA